MIETRFNAQENLIRELTHCITPQFQKNAAEWIRSKVKLHIFTNDMFCIVSQLCLSYLTSEIMEKIMLFC